MTQALKREWSSGESNPHRALTQRALALLEAGDIPWLAGNSTTAPPCDLPFDPIAGHRFDGLATLDLWKAGSERAYPTIFWSSRQQLERAGARIRTGERGTTIWVSPAAARRSRHHPGGRGIQWRYLDLLVPVSVYNLAQCSHMPDRLEVAHQCERADVEEAFHELIAATGTEWRLGAFRTFYQLSGDVIALDDWRGRDLSDFRRDWIHELIHATGHPSRLGRDLPKVFGTSVHGFEDLVAEKATSFVCASLGIAPALRHADGRDQWVALLRGDDRAFARAVASAADAAEYVLALRDAQTEALDRMEAEEAAAERRDAEFATGARRRRRGQERERWASGQVTGLRPRESLPAARPGDSPWQNQSSSSS